MAVAVAIDNLGHPRPACVISTEVVHSGLGREKIRKMIRLLLLLPMLPMFIPMQMMAWVVLVQKSRGCMPLLWPRSQLFLAWPAQHFTGPQFSS